MIRKLHTRMINGQRIRELREKRGWTQRELADRCEIGEHQIYRYEHGVSDPSAGVVAKLARMLGASADYLLDLIDTTNGHLSESGLTDAEIRQLTALPDLAETLRVFATLPKEIRESILTLVRSQK